jgi:hypothetical protein
VNRAILINNWKSGVWSLEAGGRSLEAGGRRQKAEGRRQKAGEMKIVTFAF